MKPWWSPLNVTSDLLFSADTQQLCMDCALKGLASLAQFSDILKQEVSYDPVFPIDFFSVASLFKRWSHPLQCKISPEA